jgi:hypothetical protein
MTTLRLREPNRNFKIRSPQIFQKWSSHVQILGSRRVAISLLGSLSSVVTHEPYCYMAVSTPCMWPSTLFVRAGEIAVIMQKLLGMTLQNLVALVTICLELVHPCWEWCLVIRWCNFDKPRELMVDITAFKTVGMKARFMRSLLWHCSNCYVTNADDRTLCNN